MNGVCEHGHQARKCRLCKLERENAELRKRLVEVREIAADTLGSEDFQPQFSERQHMTGPALRGNIERMAGAAREAE